jgi:uncharacterized protein involved in exopolysaccharide biosynthesis
MKFFSLALVLILGFALAGCSWNPFHKIYSATTVIQIRPRGVINLAYLKAEIDQWNRIPSDMLSPNFLTVIIKDQKLDQVWAKRFQSDHDVLSPQEALDHLREVLKIEWVSGTNIIKITASSEVPQEAANIANAVADNYKAQCDQEDTERYERNQSSLRTLITRQQKVVGDAKATVEKLPNDADAQRDLDKQQNALDSLNFRFNQDIGDAPLMESFVRIISRAMAPPE